MLLLQKIILGRGDSGEFDSEDELENDGQENSRSTEGDSENVIHELENFGLKHEHIGEEKWENEKLVEFNDSVSDGYLHNQVA